MKVYAPRITKEEIAGYEKEVFRGQIVIISDERELSRCLSALSHEEVIGIDTETRPVFAKGASPQKVALLQLSTDTTAFLVRLNVLGFPLALTHFLENSAIRKVGISLKDDFHALRRWQNFTEVASFVDLQSIVKNFGIEEMSLQKVYAIVEGKKISKRQRLTNWEAAELTEAQKQYAALDAWACLKIYKTLLQ